MLDEVEYEKLREQWASNPEWDKAGRVHDWRNYISEKVQSIWGTFTLEQQIALMDQADDRAGSEIWD